MPKSFVDLLSDRFAIVCPNDSSVGEIICRNRLSTSFLIDLRVSELKPDFCCSIAPRIQPGRAIVQIEATVVVLCCSKHSSATVWSLWLPALCCVAPISMSCGFHHHVLWLPSPVPVAPITMPCSSHQHVLGLPSPCPLAPITMSCDSHDSHDHVLR